MIAAFDIGIKNLAWCIYDASSNTIKHWENTNLIDDSKTAEEKRATAIECITCQKAARFCTLGNETGLLHYHCKRHCPTAYPVLLDSSGSEIKKLPAVSELQALLLSARDRGIVHKDTIPLSLEAALDVGEYTIRRHLLSAKKGCAAAAVPKKRADILKQLSLYYSLPLWAAEHITDNKESTLPPKKEKKATALTFDELHDNIIAFVNKNCEKFAGCKRILLENQPVLKNPVMKTVQVFLYGELRSALIRAGHKPSFELVHAKKKVAGAEKGDAGYADRKKGSETRAVEALDAAIKAGNTVARRWKDTYTAAKKKSDLADAYCMVMDACVCVPKN